MNKLLAGAERLVNTSVWVDNQVEQQKSAWRKKRDTDKKDDEKDSVTSQVWDPFITLVVRKYLQVEYCFP